MMKNEISCYNLKPKDEEVITIYLFERLLINIQIENIYNYPQRVEYKDTVRFLIYDESYPSSINIISFL